jgi:hypothetical protein
MRGVLLPWAFDTALELDLTEGYWRRDRCRALTEHGGLPVA